MGREKDKHTLALGGSQLSTHFLVGLPGLLLTRSATVAHRRAACTAPQLDVGGAAVVTVPGFNPRVATMGCLAR